jgi:DNA-binding NarL/FixJ family response regulator
LDSLDVQILRELSRGRTLEAIARSIHLSERSVRRRTRRVCEMLEVEKPIEAVVRAVRSGVI